MSVYISLPDPLYQKAKRTARLKKKTVDEFVTELVSDALNADEQQTPITENEEMSQAAKIWEKLHPQLLEKYAGKHVAIYNGSVVDSDADPLTLHRRVRKNYANKTVWMSLVEEKPFRDIKMRSPRLEQ